MRILKIAVVLLVGAGFVGCSISPHIGPGGGGIFSDFHVPAIYDSVNQVGPGSKNGSSELTSYLGLVNLGDASIYTAANNGGISEIKTVDHHYTSILGIVQTWKTNVTGE